MKTNQTTVVSQSLALVSSLIFIGLSSIPGETQAAEIAPRTAVEWQFQDSNRLEPVNNGGQYTLWNSEKKNCVKHGDRNHGIKLVWADTVSPNNIRIERPKPTPRTPPRRPPVVFGERVAIHVEGGGYLVYQDGDREEGLNLRFVEASTPEIYQWEVRGTTTSPDLAYTKRGVALFNTKKGDYVVHAKRDNAIDLGWQRSTQTAHNHK